jgi:hypothetical protein
MEKNLSCGSLYPISTRSAPLSRQSDGAAPSFLDVDGQGAMGMGLQWHATTGLSSARGKVHVMVVWTVRKK